MHKKTYSGKKVSKCTSQFVKSTCDNPKTQVYENVERNVVHRFRPLAARQHQILTHRTHFRLIRGKSVLMADDSFRAFLMHSAPCSRKPRVSQHNRCCLNVQSTTQHHLSASNKMQSCI